MDTMQSKDQNMKNSDYKVCPVCRGTGQEFYENECPEIYGDNRKIPFVRECTYCRGAIEKRVHDAKERANIPASFYKADLSCFKRDIYKTNKGEDIDISRQMRVVDSFIDEFEKWEREGMGLYIYSSMKGSGKTFLASCICNELISRYPMGTRFVSASNLIELSKQGNGRAESIYDRDPIDLLCNCKLLVLDDLGQKTGGLDWQNDLLFRITDSRMQQKLVTIFTSNIKVENLEFDDRVVDRINKMSLQITLPEYCVRSREANEKKKQFLMDIGLA